MREAHLVLIGWAQLLPGLWVVLAIPAAEEKIGTHERLTNRDRNLTFTVRWQQTSLCYTNSLFTFFSSRISLHLHLSNRKKSKTVDKGKTQDGFMCCDCILTRHQGFSSPDERGTSWTSQPLHRWRRKGGSAASDRQVGERNLKFKRTVTAVTVICQ